jgi:cell division protein FtsL
MAATRTALASAPRTRALRVVDDAPTRPDLRVVPARRPTGAIVVASLVLVFGILLATAALNTMLVSGQRDLDRIEAEIRDGEQRNQALALEVAEKESPARIVAAAEAQGMVEPDEVIWLTPRPDGGTDAMTATAGQGTDVRADDGGPTDASPTDDGDERADGGPGGSGG